MNLKRLVLLPFLVATLFGLVIALIAIHQRRIASISFHETTGYVIGAGETATHNPITFIATYWYVAEGRKIHTRSISPYQQFLTGDSEWVKEQVNYYRRNHRLIVYYNPKDPTEAYIDLRIPDNAWRLTLVLGLATITCTFFLIRIITSRIDQRR